MSGTVPANADKPTSIGLIKVSRFELVTDVVIVFGLNLCCHECKFFLYWLMFRFMFSLLIGV